MKNVHPTSQQLQEAKYIKMTSSPVGRLVTGFAMPSIVSMLISGLYNVVDTFFIGKINTQSVAALGIVFAYMGMIQAIAFFMGHGSGNFISRALGQKHIKEAEQMVAVGFFSSVIIGSLIMILGLIFIRPVLIFLGSTPTILPPAQNYFTFILLGTPFIMGCFTMNNQMRHQGNAFLSMIGIASGAVLNVILDPIFIFVFDLGISGAGLATAISQCVSFLIMISICGARGGLKIRYKNFIPTKKCYNEIVAGGLPSLARQGFMAVTAICLNNVASSYGDTAVASFSVVGRVSMLAGAAMIGYGQGFQPVCGFNYGAGLYQRVKKALTHSLLVSTIYCTTLAIVGYIFAYQIVRFFRADDIEVVSLGAEILRYQCISFPLQGLIVLSNMYLQNIRKTIPALIVAAARQGLFFLPALFIGKYFFGLWGAEISQTVSDICAFILALPLLVIYVNKMMKDEK